MLKIRAFVPDWPGPKQHAQMTADLLRPHLENVMVLGGRPDDYFTDQWNRMLDLFLKTDGEVLMSVMGDVWPPYDVAGLLEKASYYMGTSGVGIYAPAVEYVGQKLFRHKLKPFGPDYPRVFHVPMPEMLCWFVRRDVIEAMPRIDPKINKCGWGIDYLAVAAAWSIGAHVILDDNFVARHIKGIGYPIEKAEVQFDLWLNELGEPWESRVKEAIEEKNRIGVRVTAKIIGGTNELRNKFASGIDQDKDLLTIQIKLPVTYDEWLKATEDTQDLFVLEESFSEDALRACQKNNVINVRFVIPMNPHEWNISNMQTVGEINWRPSVMKYHYWRHPKWILNLTDFMDVPVAWLLPNKMEYRSSGKVTPA